MNRNIKYEMVLGKPGLRTDTKELQERINKFEEYYGKSAKFLAYTIRYRKLLGSIDNIHHRSLRNLHTGEVTKRWGIE